MTVSLFELFKIGIGPSSSHTVGPMRAARDFVVRLQKAGSLQAVKSLRTELYGSLALTGRGHATDKAILLGLSGERPAEVDPDAADRAVATIRTTETIRLLGEIVIPFIPDRDIEFHRKERLPFHSNGMKFIASDANSGLLLEETYYSIGGGFILNAVDATAAGQDSVERSVPYPYRSARELLDIGRENGLSIADVVLANERAQRSGDEIEAGIRQLWATMQRCIERGCRASGLLPGKLRIERRAPKLYKQLSTRDAQGLEEPMAVMDWVNLWAIAVNEENAAGGRVVTAPTNGAAGIIPAVLSYYLRFCRGADEAGIRAFFLTATAIGALYKENASISGAEVGCQGEVGVACSMAAGGLTAALGGSNAQVENAAEIGMEHNLGLTCDPIGGLVQIPCIERNAMGSVKAIDASRLAMLGDGTHKVSLDKVIATMRRTGADMKSKYKETSRGGLAVNVVEC